MHFATSTLIALLSASIACASPTSSGKFDADRKKDWDSKWTHNKFQNGVFKFDKTIICKATPDQVRNGTTSAPGEPGAKGLFRFGISVEENTICYNITLSGVTGDYQSLALTATHIHEAPKGASGPPRLTFPNPKGPDAKRVSYGCLTGPFKTGILSDGVDTGDTFHVREIVEAPANFFCDTHTKKYTLGAVRGQLG